ncbi:MAG: host attachment protein [Persicimonas sp.]
MWILVADASQARLFSAKPKYSAPGEFEFDSFETVNEWNNDEGRAKNQDLETDRPGRFYDRTGSGEGIGEKSGWEPAEEAKTHEARAFARELIEYLTSNLQKGRFEKLTLAAPPKFLGIFRDASNPTLTKVINTEIGKDLSNVADHDLRERLPELMG